jgi:hypothetical protein
MQAADPWPQARVDEVVYWASTNRWHDVMEALRAGFPVNARGSGVWGRTALHYAALGGCREPLERLLAAGADVNVRDNFDDTPAHYAATYNMATVLEDLVKAGADLNARSMGSLFTPLFSAALTRRAAPQANGCLHFLLSLPQVDLAATDAGGCTVVDRMRRDGGRVAVNMIVREVCPRGPPTPPPPTTSSHRLPPPATASIPALFAAPTPSTTVFWGGGGGALRAVCTGCAGSPRSRVSGRCCCAMGRWTRSVPNPGWLCPLL